MGCLLSTSLRHRSAVTTGHRPSTPAKRLRTTRGQIPATPEEELTNTPGDEQECTGLLHHTEQKTGTTEKGVHLTSHMKQRRNLEYVDPEAASDKESCNSSVFSTF